MVRNVLFKDYLVNMMSDKVHLSSEIKSKTGNQFILIQKRKTKKN